MKTNFKRSIDCIKNEVSKCLEGKSIYEMTVWTRDHAQHLKWFHNYDEEKIEAIIKPFLGIAYYLYENFKDDCDAVEDFKALCIVCVLELEMNCR